jgi:hypothetical protein
MLNRAALQASATAFKRANDALKVGPYDCLMKGRLCFLRCAPCDSSEAGKPFASTLGLSLRVSSEWALAVMRLRFSVTFAC